MNTILKSLKDHLDTLKKHCSTKICNYAEKTNFQKLSKSQLNLIIVLVAFFAGFMVSIFPRSSLCLLLIPIALIARVFLIALHDSLIEASTQQTPATQLYVELRNIFSDVFLYLSIACVGGISDLLIISIVILLII